MPFARLTFAVVFILMIVNHFSEGVQSEMHNFIPFAEPIFGILAIFSALSVMFGFKVRWSAWFMIFFIGYDFLTHAILNNDPTNINYILSRNLSLLAPAMMLAYFGAGPVSIDRENKQHRKRFRRHRRESGEAAVVGGAITKL